MKSSSNAQVAMDSFGSFNVAVSVSDIDLYTVNQIDQLVSQANSSPLNMESENTYYKQGLIVVLNLTVSAITWALVIDFKKATFQNPIKQTCTAILSRSTSSYNR